VPGAVEVNSFFKFVPCFSWLCPLINYGPTGLSGPSAVLTFFEGIFPRSFVDPRQRITLFCPVFCCVFVFFFFFFFFCSPHNCFSCRSPACNPKPFMHLEGLLFFFILFVRERLNRHLCRPSLFLILLCSSWFFPPRDYVMCSITWLA